MKAYLRFLPVYLPEHGLLMAVQENCIGHIISVSTLLQTVSSLSNDEIVFIHGLIVTYFGRTINSVSAIRVIIM